jgi:hypothetical protein
VTVFLSHALSMCISQSLRVFCRLGDQIGYFFQQLEYFWKLIVIFWKDEVAKTIVDILGELLLKNIWYFFIFYLNMVQKCFDSDILDFQIEHGCLYLGLSTVWATFLKGSFPNNHLVTLFANNFCYVYQVRHLHNVFFWEIKIKETE